MRKELGKRGSRRVLVVDDDEHMRKYLRTVLETGGYACDLAVEGMSALRRLYRSDYDLIIMDMDMPGLDGPSAISAINRLCPEQKVLVVSGHLRDDTVDWLWEGGRVAGWCRKPVQPRELLEAVGVVLDGSMPAASV